jgi:Na+/phosphate symporter
MQTTVYLQEAWAPALSHTMFVVLTATAAVLLATALLVFTGLVVQDLTGGVPLTPLAPDPGLDL